MQNKFLPGIVIISILLTWLFPIAAFAEAVGFFSKVEGRVDILKTGVDASTSVKTGAAVEMGDIVRTKSDGRAEIIFKDKSIIRLASESRIKINEYLLNADGSRDKGAIGLFRGKVRAIVSKARAGIIPVFARESSFNISTRSAIAGVRGTDFFVFFDKGITGVIFKEGSGFVANPNIPDKIVDVNAGQASFVVNFNAPPLPPRSAMDIEIINHTRDTTLSENHKEGITEEHKPRENTAVTEARTEEETKTEDAKTVKTEVETGAGGKSQRELSAAIDVPEKPVILNIFGVAMPSATDIPAAGIAISPAVTVDTSSLIPITETQPSLLTDVKVNLVFR